MRLYVGGLPYQTNEQDLLDLFGQVGNVVEATVITDRDTGRSKGFGFVEMADDQSGHTAVERLNGTLLGNRGATHSGHRGGALGAHRRRDSRRRSCCMA